MSGWVLKESILTSRRFNRLYLHPEGEFAQIIYLLSYTLADSWGHIPFDPEWILLKVIPGNKSCTLERVQLAMVMLIAVGLWGKPYCIDNNLYVYIFNFEKFNRDGLRKRRKGAWEAENGEIPTKDRAEDFIKNIEYWRKVRDESKNYINIIEYPIYSETFRNVSEYFGTFCWYSTGIGIGTGTKNKTSSPDGGFYEKMIPNEITLSGVILRKSYLIKILKFVDNDIDQFGRILYRARKAKDPYSYIQSGISNKFIFSSVIEEDTTPAEVKKWMDKLFGIQKKEIKKEKTQPTSIGDIIKQSNIGE